jgi:hypothetical protein
MCAPSIAGVTLRREGKYNEILSYNKFVEGSKRVKTTVSIQLSM